jgi:DMATS type aromatic prenyltransferase
MRTLLKDNLSVEDYGVERLSSLARAVGLDAELGQMERIFRLFMAAEGDDPKVRGLLGGRPSWASDVCDDHSPFEFSVAIGGGAPELRMLVESRRNWTLEANQAWGLEVNEMLRRDFGARLDRFEEVRDLFLPAGADCVFAIWHAVSFWPKRAPEFKCYLNVNARGPAEAPRLVEEALRRLGFGAVWPRLLETGLSRPELDRLAYFSLDLSPSALPRVKIYFRHLQPTVDDLERACSSAPDHQPGRVAEFCRMMSGGQELYGARGPVSCASLTEHDRERPTATTIYFPIAAYAPNDRVARNRIASYLVLQELPFAAYVEPLQAFAARRLDDGIGMQSYASLRSGPKARVTVYFSPECYAVTPPRPLASSIR